MTSGHLATTHSTKNLIVETYIIRSSLDAYTTHRNLMLDFNTLIIPIHPKRCSVY